MCYNYQRQYGGGNMNGQRITSYKRQYGVNMNGQRISYKYRYGGNMKSGKL